ncbi:hypothetical protein P3S68_011812 [Capsicum galapagoense]
MSENRAEEIRTGTTSSASIDPASALYMHPSENTGSSLTPTVFYGTAIHLGEEDLADSLQYINNDKELWDELADKYDQTNEARLYHLQREINELTQGSLNITGYYTKMKKLW